MRSMRVAIGATALINAALITGAPARLAAQQPTFRSSVEVALIDVTVVDRAAFPVGDLKPADVLAKRAIGRFLDQLVPTDRVAIVTLPRLPLRIGLTSNRRVLFDALSLVSPVIVPAPPTDYRIGLSEAYEIGKRDGVTATDVVQRECIDKLTTPASTTDPTGNREIEACRTNVLIQANQMAMMGHDRAQRSLDALRRLAGLLSSIPRPKTLVLVSGGFPPPVTATEFTPVAMALAAAQVNLYSIYLQKDVSGTSAAQPSPTPAQDEWLTRSGIENVTGAAGGTLLLVTGEFEPLLDVVSRELAGSYLLGVEVAAADSDGHPHRVEVRVNRTGLSIRSRSTSSGRRAGRPARRPRRRKGSSRDRARPHARRRRPGSASCRTTGFSPRPEIWKEPETSTSP